MTLQEILDFTINRGFEIAIKLLIAIVIWVIGRFIIKKVTNFVGFGIERTGRLDATLTRYLVTILSILLTILLVMFILSRFGIETTSFAALLAGIGLAIGTAWGGLLTHFAAGVFMQILRPFKVGDYVSAGNAEGTVTEIGLFTSKILAVDNVTTIVGNNKMFSDNIKNFTAQPHRRVDCRITLYHDIDTTEVLKKLKAAVEKIPNVITTPAPEVEILSFTEAGPEIGVRPFCHNDHYWQVLFDTNSTIAEAVATNNWPAPATHEVEWQIDGNKR